MSALDDFNARARALDISDAPRRWAPANQDGVIRLWPLPDDAPAYPPYIPPVVESFCSLASCICVGDGFKGVTVEPTPQGILFRNRRGDSQTIPADSLKSIGLHKFTNLTLQILDSLQMTDKAMRQPIVTVGSFPGPISIPHKYPLSAEGKRIEEQWRSMFPESDK